MRVKKSLVVWLLIIIVGIFAFPSSAQTATPTNTPTNTPSPTPTASPTPQLVTFLVPGIPGLHHHAATGVNFYVTLIRGTPSGSELGSTNSELEFSIITSESIYLTSMIAHTRSAANSRLVGRSWTYDMDNNGVNVDSGDHDYPQVWTGAQNTVGSTGTLGVSVTADIDNLTFDYFYMSMTADNDMPLDGYVGLRFMEITYLWTPSPPSTSGFFKPLVNADSDTGLINNSLNFNPSTLEYSEYSTARVHAATSGYISLIERLTSDTCDQYVGQTSYWFYSNDDNGHCHFGHPTDDEYALIGIDTGQIDAYAVTLTAGDYSFIYIIDRPITGLDIGSEVSAGCVLGNVAKIRTAFSGQAVKGLTTVSVFADTSHIDGTFLFDLEPSTIAPYCADEPERPYDPTYCINDDPYLESIGSWRKSSGGFWMQGGGILLEGDTYISQLLNLELPKDYQVAVGLINDGDSGIQGGTLVIQLGQAEITHQLFYGDQQQTLVLNADNPAPDGGDFHTLKITNDYITPFLVNFICVKSTDEGEEIPPSPTRCYLINYDLDQQSDEWNVTGTFVWPDGEIRLATGATLSQETTLPEGDYTVLVSVGLYYGPGFSYEDEEGGVDISIGWDGSSYALNQAKYQDLAGFNNKLVEGDFSVSAETTDDFEMSFALSSPAPTGVLGIVIRSICITASEDSGGIFDLDCGIIAAPQDSSFGAWVSWLWGNQNKFFRCELIVLLNKMYKLIYDSYKVFIWSVRYWIEFGNAAIYWLSSDVVGWLNGHFANMSLSNEGAVSTPSCDNLWCTIVSLFDVLNNLVEEISGLISQIVESVVVPILEFLLYWLNLVFILFMDVILAILNLFFIIIEIIIELIFASASWMEAIASAWNDAPPIVLPGMWDCVNNPTDNYVCWMFWAAENTIFSGTYGALIIPLFVSLAYIMIAIGWVKRFRQAAIEVGELL